MNWVQIIYIYIYIDVVDVIITMTRIWNDDIGVDNYRFKLYLISTILNLIAL